MSKKQILFIAVLGFIPIIILAAVYGQLPAQVPTSYGFDGSVSYSEKHNLWAIAVMPLFMGLMFSILPKIDPRRKNVQKFEGEYFKFTVVFELFMTGLLSILISEAIIPGRFDIVRVIIIGVGVLFMFIGNMMPKMKSNYFMGIKTPWTLSDDTVWLKTHRLSGYLWVSGGAFMAIFGSFLNEKLFFVLFMFVILSMTCIPLAYSYILYTKINGKNS